MNGTIPKCSECRSQLRFSVSVRRRYFGNSGGRVSGPIDGRNDGMSERERERVSQSVSPANDGARRNDRRLFSFTLMIGFSCDYSRMSETRKFDRHASRRHACLYAYPSWNFGR